MQFVDYIPASFSNINKTPTTLVTANENTLVVNSLIVCNRGKTSIRFNLKKITIETPDRQIFLINEYEIKPYNTIDIVKEKGLNIFLRHSNAPSVSDSLVCFSNGLTQIFDCELNYTQLKQLPLN